MKDAKGLYYYPFPQNHRIRMYVRKVGAEICFRMWNADDDKMWEQHGWVPYGAVKQAIAMYQNTRRFDPKQAYDINVARALIWKDAEI